MHIALDFRYRESVRLLQESSSACPGLRVWDVPASYDEALLQCLAQIDIAIVGFEAAHLTVARHNWWRDALTARSMDVELRTTDGVVEQLRVVKDDSRSESCEKGRGVCPRSPMRRCAIRLVSASAPWRLCWSGRSGRPGSSGGLDTIVASGRTRPCRTTVPAPDHDRRRLLVLDFAALGRILLRLTRTVSNRAALAESQRVYDAVSPPSRLPSLRSGRGSRRPRGRRRARRAPGARVGRGVRTWDRSWPGSEFTKNPESASGAMRCPPSRGAGEWSLC